MDEADLPRVVIGRGTPSVDGTWVATVLDRALVGALRANAKVLAGVSEFTASLARRLDDRRDDVQ